MHNIFIVSLVCLATHAEPEPQKAMEPPRFVQPVNALQVVEGSQAVFETTVAGQPLPEVAWFREGHQIQHSDEFQVLRDGNKCLLVIKEVFPEDSGVFTCRISNPGGVAECSAELFVEGEFVLRQMHVVLVVTYLVRMEFVSLLSNMSTITL